MHQNWLDRLMAPLVEWWDRTHGYPREWDSNHWTFTRRTMAQPFWWLRRKQQR